MPALAVIDDREDMRETLARNIATDLPKPWSVIQSDPLPTMSDYSSWIAENEVAALILDERLQEQIAGRKTHVDYSGHELARHLRKHWPSLPIFMVTTHRGDSALQDPKNEVAFEEIFNRDDFYNRSNIYTQRIVRAAQRFLDTYQKELTALGACASKIASGRGSRQDKERLLAIQTKINSAFPSLTALTDSACPLKELENAVQRLEQITAKAKKLTKKARPKK
jgi:hypothetical protein